jgi:hypothetical protein
MMRALCWGGSKPGPGDVALRDPAWTAGKRVTPAAIEASKTSDWATHAIGCRSVTEGRANNGPQSPLAGGAGLLATRVALTMTVSRPMRREDAKVAEHKRTGRGKLLLRRFRPLLSRHVGRWFFPRTQRPLFEG